MRVKMGGDIENLVMELAGAGGPAIPTPSSGSRRGKGEPEPSAPVKWQTWQREEY